MAHDSRALFTVLLAAALGGAILASSCVALAQPPPHPDVPAPTAPAADEADDDADFTRDAPPQKDQDALEEALAVRPGGLRADTVAERMVKTSPSVRAKVAALEAARAKVLQTTVAFFPRLTLKASYTRLSLVESGFGGALLGAQNPGLVTVGPCPGGAGQCVFDAGGSPVGAAEFAFPSNQNSYQLSAGLLVPLSDYILRLPDAAAAASAQRDSAATAIDGERTKVAHEGRVLYYNWIRTLGQQALAKSALERIEARLKDAQAVASVGHITKVDLLRVETLVELSKQFVEDAATLRKLVERQLAVLMDQRSTKVYAVGEEVTRIKPIPPGTTEQLISEALRRRSEIRQLDQAISALGSGAAATRGGLYPRLDAFADVTYANPNQRYFLSDNEWNASWLVGIGATWTINDTFSTMGASSELEAKKRELEAQRDNLRRGIELQVTAAHLQLKKAHLAIEISGRAVATAEEAYRVGVALYRVGGATTTTIIDAESELLGAKLQQLNAQVSAHIAHATLMHTTGRDVARREVGGPLAPRR